MFIKPFSGYRFDTGFMCEDISFVTRFCHIEDVMIQSTEPSISMRYIVKRSLAGNYSEILNGSKKPVINRFVDYVTTLKVHVCTLQMFFLLTRSWKGFHS
jgi:hypothetical protein